ncbi:MAG: RNB domain-containing ribonuclease [Candidatus Dadabacteria bacterium]|nr:RNB domain-containing ribonuclease [Candidatus Dadabacteria bacterium]
MPLKLKVNEIVFFKKRNFISLASINELNNDQISVITEEGKQLNLQADQIVYCSGAFSQKTANSSEIKLELRALRRQLDENREKVDLKIIWDCMYDPEKSNAYKLQDILELYIDKDSSCLEKLQFVWALQRDEIYFKKQEGLIYLNTPSESEEIIRRKDEALRKEKEKEQALNWLKAVHEGSVEINKEDIEEYSDYIELIKGYAVFIDKYERLKEAKALLNAVGIRDEIDAIEFLIKSGLWDKNEDPIFKRYGIKQTYPQKVINQSEDLVNKEINYDRLLDITKLQLISIDDENTSDIDDALSVEIIGDKTRVGVHISNVAAFIYEKDYLDHEALKRGETIYLAEGNISMFPPELVSKLLTLSAKNIRKALSLFVTFDSEFNISNYEFVQTKINVNKNISYKEANDNYLKTDQGRRLLDITNALRQKRVKNGAHYFTASDNED